MFGGKKEDVQFKNIRHFVKANQRKLFEINIHRINFIFYDSIIKQEKNKCSFI
jgi:hypothetical protein